MSYLGFLRLRQQQIINPLFSTPESVVEWMGAVQAQDPNHAQTAVAIRILDGNEEQVSQALDAGLLVRTHVLRPTWHLVSARDARWMLKLSAPQIRALSRALSSQLGLDAAIFNRCNDLIAAALEGNRHMTRMELASLIEKNGLPSSGSHMVHIMFNAELDALVCNGIPKGKEQTYALMDEKIGPGLSFTHEEALAELARRYFQSHGPATLPDFTWWSGLKVGDAKKALASVAAELKEVTIEGQAYWCARDADLRIERHEHRILLPGFDEFLIAYKNRDAVLDPQHNRKVITVNGIFKPIVVVDGHVVGGWEKKGKERLIRFFD
ncbi:MAG: AlkZ family DNA glycosylase [Saprospiraceae bacterium]|nr:AlkZ family DNA glycosylase [Saprospiraceae bacterium]